MLTSNRDNLLSLSHQYSFTNEQYERFVKYIELLETWNQRTNLVSGNDLPRIVSRHIAESLLLTELDSVNKAGKIMDLGSGAGFPGIPLAIMYPDKYIHLVESRNRKAAFLQQVVIDLEWSTVKVHGVRAEDLTVSSLAGAPDVITARAVSALPNLWNWCHLLLDKSGCILAYKGGDIENELAGLKGQPVKTEIIPITGLPEETGRFFVKLSKI